MLQERIKKFWNVHSGIVPIVKEIVALEGVPYLVGGCVRDMVLGLKAKDVDIEVHGLSLDKLETILKKFGRVKLVGKQFGVLILEGLDIDWSIPRKDSKGRKPQVELDPDMDIKEAAKRRDLTINALSIDFADALKGSCEIIDPYNGLVDIKSKTLRVVDEELFYDDPLRFYRVIQFISRFEMIPDDKLIEICKEISLEGVAKERIYDELKKLLLRSKRPSFGIRFLKEIGRLGEVMPEVAALIDVIQPEKYHPEGDVFEHTMQVLDAGAKITFYEDDYEKLIIMIAALCHDMGKPKVVDANGRAIGHENVGVDISKTFLKRFTDDTFLRKAVGKLVRYHMAPSAFLEQGATLSAYKRLARKLHPEVNLRQLGIVALCDLRGRNGESSEPLAIYDDLFNEYVSKIQEANVELGQQIPVLLGRHLIDVVEPGKKMGELLSAAYEIQIEEGVVDVDELKRRVTKLIKE